MEYEFSIVPENCRIEQKEFWYCYRYDIRNKYARSLFIFGYLEFKGSTIYKNIDLLEKESENKEFIKELKNRRKELDLSAFRIRKLNIFTPENNVLLVENLALKQLLENRTIKNYYDKNSEENNNNNYNSDFLIKKINQLLIEKNPILLFLMN